MTYIQQFTNHLLMKPENAQVRPAWDPDYV